MTNTDQVRPTSPSSRAQGATNSTPAATASVSALHPAKSQKAVPAHEAIAQKAYEIWLSEGQALGCENKHWFEAELQLQRAQGPSIR